MAANRGLFVIALDRRPFSAKTDRRDLGLRDSLQQQGAAHSLSTPFAQADVVFAGTALVGVAFEFHLEFRVAGQVVRGGGHDVRIFRLDFRFIEIEINHFTGQRTCSFSEPAGAAVRIAPQGAGGSRRAFSARG